MQKGEMSLDEFSKNLKVCNNLGLGIASFTGGEPLLWGHIYDALLMCSRKNVMTEITTNGRLLSRNVIDDLANADLDYLMVSVDSVMKNNYTAKTLKDKPEILSLLNYAQIEKRLLVTCNAVLTRHNATGMVDLAKILTRHSIPLSIGFVDAPVAHNTRLYDSLKFDPIKDHELLRNVTSELISLKRSGALIVEPEEYFANYVNHLRGGSVWRCRKDNARSFTITPNSEVLICSRLEETIGSVREMSVNKLQELGKAIPAQLAVCNPTCYSNCSFNTSYYQTNPLSFLKGVLIPGLRARHRNKSNALT